MVSKHGLYMGSPGSIPTAVTTRTAAGGDAKHVSLNHWLAPPYQGVKLVQAKCWEDSYRLWPWVGCKWLLSHHLKVMAHTKFGWVPCWEVKWSDSLLLALEHYKPKTFNFNFWREPLSVEREVVNPAHKVLSHTLNHLHKLFRENLMRELPSVEWERKN